MTVPPVLDAAGRRRLPATMPGDHAGRPPRNKGRLYPADPPTVEAIVAVMREASDDRMVCALVTRKLSRAVNRKRVLRVMRERRLIQRRRRLDRRRRPGFFRVTRPDELWHLDMTSVWVAEHGWCLLGAGRPGRVARDRADRGQRDHGPPRRHGRRRPRTADR